MLGFVCLFVSKVAQKTPENLLLKRSHKFPLETSSSVFQKKIFFTEQKDSEPMRSSAAGSAKHGDTLCVAQRQEGRKTEMMFSGALPDVNRIFQPLQMCL